MAPQEERRGGGICRALSCELSTAMGMSWSRKSSELAKNAFHASQNLDNHPTLSQHSCLKKWYYGGLGRKWGSVMRKYFACHNALTPSGHGLAMVW